MVSTGREPGLTSCAGTLAPAIFSLASPRPSHLAIMEEEERARLPLTPGGWRPSKESLCPGLISTSEASLLTPQTRTSSICVKSKFHLSWPQLGRRCKPCLSRFGPIISTKAILDKATNRCKGYGFVDFESPNSALAAVNELQAQGIQAQMARQAEQDPTNLYIANLPHSVKESDLESMFSAYGQVMLGSPHSHSTRSEVCLSPGHLHQDSERLEPDEQRSRLCEVRRAGRLSVVVTPVCVFRMESREKCEQIISIFNNRALPGSQQPLVVKFADGGETRRISSDTGHFLISWPKILF